MKNFEQLASQITAVIRENGTGAITGAQLQEVLLAMKDKMQLSSFEGIATPSTTVTTDYLGEHFYIAYAAGTYSNFDGAVLDGSAVTMFYKMTGQTTWSHVQLNTDATVVDSTITEASENPVKSSAIYAALADKADQSEVSQIAQDVYTKAYGVVTLNEDSGNTRYIGSEGGLGSNPMFRLFYVSCAKGDKFKLSYDADGPSSGAARIYAVYSVNDINSASSSSMLEVGGSVTSIQQGEDILIEITDDSAKLLVVTSINAAGGMKMFPFLAKEYDTTTANGKSIFKTYEKVNDVKIVNDFTIGGEHNVLSAEQGKNLNTKLGYLEPDINRLRIRGNEISQYSTNDGHFLRNDGGVGSLAGAAIIVYAVTAGDILYVSWNGNEGSQFAKYAFYNSSTIAYENAVLVEKQAYSSGGSFVRVPIGATYLAVTRYRNDGYGYATLPYIAKEQINPQDIESSASSENSGKLVTSGVVFNETQKIPLLLGDFPNIFGNNFPYGNWQTLENSVSGKYIKSNGDLGGFAASSVYYMPYTPGTAYKLIYSGNFGAGTFLTFFSWAIYSTNDINSANSSNLLAIGRTLGNLQKTEFVDILCAYPSAKLLCIGSYTTYNFLIGSPLSIGNDLAKIAEHEEELHYFETPVALSNYEDGKYLSGYGVATNYANGRIYILPYTPKTLYKLHYAGIWPSASAMTTWAIYSTDDPSSFSNSTGLAKGIQCAATTPNTQIDIYCDSPFAKTLVLSTDAGNATLMPIVNSISSKSVKEEIVNLRTEIGNQLIDLKAKTARYVFNNDELKIAYPFGGNDIMFTLKKKGPNSLFEFYQIGIIPQGSDIETASQTLIQSVGDMNVAMIVKAEQNINGDNWTGYDISENTAIGGVPTEYGSLADALGVDGANVPSDSRSAKMYVKYIDSTTHEYVQFKYNLTSIVDSDFSNTENWTQQQILVYNKYYTGGNHGYNNQGNVVGNIPTARSVSLKFYADGKLIYTDGGETTYGKGDASVITMVWENAIQGYNTTLKAGNGREILTEKRVMDFENGKFTNTVELIPIEDVFVELFYGYASMLYNCSSYKYVGGGNRGSINVGTMSNSGGKATSSMIAISTDYNFSIEMFIDRTYDLGDRSMLGENDTDFLASAEGKMYGRVIRNQSLPANNHYFIKGGWKFSPFI